MVSIPLNRVWLETHDEIDRKLFKDGRLNPLKSGLVGNFHNDGKRTFYISLNPLKSGLVGNKIQPIWQKYINFCLNPLKSGLVGNYKDNHLELGTIESQSP